MSGSPAIARGVTAPVEPVSATGSVERTQSFDQRVAEAQERLREIAKSAAKAEASKADTEAILTELQKELGNLPVWRKVLGDQRAIVEQKNTQSQILDLKSERAAQLTSAESVVGQLILNAQTGNEKAAKLRADGKSIEADLALRHAEQHLTLVKNLHSNALEPSQLRAYLQKLGNLTGTASSQVGAEVKALHLREEKIKAIPEIKQAVHSSIITGLAATKLYAPLAMYSALDNAADVAVEVLHGKTKLDSAVGRFTEKVVSDGYSAGLGVVMRLGGMAGGAAASRVLPSTMPMLYRLPAVGAFIGAGAIESGEVVSRGIQRATAWHNFTSDMSASGIDLNKVNPKSVANVYQSYLDENRLTAKTFLADQVFNLSLGAVTGALGASAKMYRDVATSQGIRRSIYAAENSLNAGVGLGITEAKAKLTGQERSGSERVSDIGAGFISALLAAKATPHPKSKPLAEAAQATRAVKESYSYEPDMHLGYKKGEQPDSNGFVGDPKNKARALYAGVVGMAVEEAVDGPLRDSSHAEHLTGWADEVVTLTSRKIDAERRFVAARYPRFETLSERLMELNAQKKVLESMRDAHPDDSPGHRSSIRALRDVQKQQARIGYRWEQMKQKIEMDPEVRHVRGLYAQEWVRTGDAVLDRTEAVLHAQREELESSQFERGDKRSFRLRRISPSERLANAIDSEIRAMEAGKLKLPGSDTRQYLYLEALREPTFANLERVAEMYERWVSADPRFAGDPRRLQLGYAHSPTLHEMLRISNELQNPITREDFVRRVTDARMHLLLGPSSSLDLFERLTPPLGLSFTDDAISAPYYRILNDRMQRGDRSEDAHRARYLLNLATGLFHLSQDI